MRPKIWDNDLKKNNGNLRVTWSWQFIFTIITVKPIAFCCPFIQKVLRKTCDELWYTSNVFHTSFPFCVKNNNPFLNWESQLTMIKLREWRNPSKGDCFPIVKSLILQYNINHKSSLPLFWMNGQQNAIGLTVIVVKILLFYCKISFILITLIWNY